MASQAGLQLVAGQIPGEEIAYEVLASDSSTFDSTEVEIMTVDASVVSGHTYWVEWEPKVKCSSSPENVQLRIREDNISGTQLGLSNLHVPADSSSSGFGGRVTGRYDADATETKTFSATCDGFAGTTGSSLAVEATGPTFMRVSYVGPTP